MTNVAISLYVIGYLLAFGFEAMTLNIRLAGAQLGRNAYAGFLVTACLLGNRLGASLLFPSGGFLLDKAYSTLSFLNLFSVSAVAMSIVYGLIIVNQARVVNLLSGLFPREDQEPDVVVERKDGLKNQGQEISRSAVVLTTLIGQLGIFLPVLVASLVLDYRATIVQLGFLINSIGTIITIFFIERKMALHAEFSPDRLGHEMRKLLIVKALVVLMLGAATLGGAILIA